MRSSRHPQPGTFAAHPSPTSHRPLGLSHLQFEAMIVAARASSNPFDFALVAMLGLLGLRVFEACQASIDDLGEEHGHRVLRVLGKGTKLALIPLPPAVGRAIDRAVGDRIRGPVLLNRNGNRMDRHAATRRLRHLAKVAGVRMPRMHPHMLRHMFATDAVTGGLPVHIAARLLGHASLTTTQAYLAVVQDDLVRSYRSFVDARRAVRPAAEYREPTNDEWREFQQTLRATQARTRHLRPPLRNPLQA
jgi:integrase/recombinase XerD